MVRQLSLGLISVVVGASLIATAQVHSGGHAGTQSNPMMRAMMPSMTRMHSMKPTGNIDRDFAMMMIEHHRGAMAMAQVEVARGKDPTLKAMARKMIKDQQAEIAKMQARLKQIR